MMASGLVLRGPFSFPSFFLLLLAKIKTSSVLGDFPYSTLRDSERTNEPNGKEHMHDKGNKIHSEVLYIV